MPAPTALQRAPEALATEITREPSSSIVADESEPILTTPPYQNTQQPESQPQNEPPIADSTEMDVDAKETATQSLFSPEKPSKTTYRPEERKIRIPPHRLTPLKTHWPQIYPPLVTHLALQLRMNLARKTVELRTSPTTPNPGEAIQKGADFITAFTLGFDLDDAIALLRLDDLYIQSFEVRDVKQSLSGESLGRAIGRIAGKDGKTKFAIENASRTRIVLADSKVHILGGFKNLGVAREAVVSLILGHSPGKVYGNLRTVGARMKERF